MLFLAVSASEFMFFLFPVAGAMFLCYGIYQAVTDSRGGDKSKIMARLQDRSTGGGASGREKRIRESLLRRPETDDSNLLYKFVSGLSVVPKLQTSLDQANVDTSATKFLSTLLAASLVTSMGLLVLGMGALIALAVGTAILFLPLLWLKMKRSLRMRKLVNQLPDVFEMMSQSLRAGHSFAGAIQLVSEQLPDPAGTEFGRVFHEQNLGLKAEDALVNMANRCDQMDIRFFVTAVLIQRQTGGDLAEILDKISSVIRSRIELLGMVRGLTAEGRMSGWVLLALPVVVFFASLSMNREYAMTLINEPQGRMLLCLAGGMQLMGMALIKKIVNIKV